MIDGTQSTIVGREEAMPAWLRLTAPSEALQSMLIFVPIAKPKTERERQLNPYQAFAIGGSAC